MNYNYQFRNSSDAITGLLADLLDHGSEVPSRAGNTKELTQVGITLEKPLERELLVPGRRPNLAAQIAETMWILSGRNDVEWLSLYLPRAKDFSDDGKVWRAGYGPRLRNFQSFDQLGEVVRLLRSDPTTRQAVISLWDPTSDTQPSKDIPCNDWLHFLGRDRKLDLHVAIRSNDAIWGWSGINAFEWSVLLEVVAGMVGQEVGALHFSVSSFHLYEHHWDKAKRIVEAAAVRKPLLESPRFRVRGWQDDPLEYLDELIQEWFQQEAAIRAGITLHIADFPEPMMRSWLWVLAWWWTGDNVFLDMFDGTRLQAAAEMSVQPKQVISPNRARELAGLPSFTNSPAATIETYDSSGSFVAYVDALHRDKHQAYGDSWKRRGEMLGILANIARKIDRLGTNSADETSADTAIDLLVYLCKYRWWMVDEQGAPVPTATTFSFPGMGPKTANVGDTVMGAHLSDHTEPVRALLEKTEMGFRSFEDTFPKPEHLEAELTQMFSKLEDVVKADSDRIVVVDDMIESAYALAYQLWSAG